VQAVAGRDARGNSVVRLYSRAAARYHQSFPDLLPSLHLPGAIDGGNYWWCATGGCNVQRAAARLNRKVVSPKLTKDYPIHLRAYDLLGRCRQTICASYRLRAPRKAGSVSSKTRPTRASTCRPTIAFDSWAGAERGAADPASPCGRRCRSGRRRDAEAPRRALSAGPTKGQWGNGSATRTSSTPS